MSHMRNIDRQLAGEQLLFLSIVSGERRSGLETIPGSKRTRAILINRPIALSLFRLAICVAARAAWSGALMKVIR
jgi:hypothetical protein